MRPEVIKFLPLATMLLALVAGSAIDPMAERPIWWAPAAGFAMGLALQFVIRRSRYGSR
jgi:hypothetical protein